MTLMRIHSKRIQVPAGMRRACCYGTAIPYRVLMQRSWAGVYCRGLLENFNQVESIDLRCSRHLTDTALSKLATAGFRRLQEINLECCTGLTDTGMAVLGACGHLTLLNLAGSLIEDSGLTTVTAGCLKLEELGLRACTRVTDTGIAAVGENCKVSLLFLFLTWVGPARNDPLLCRGWEGGPMLNLYLRLTCRSCSRRSLCWCCLRQW
jgi:hypothetical protein